MSKIRVFLIRNIGPDKFGGGETYQIKLGLLLKKCGFEPFILTASKELMREAKDKGIKVIETPYIRRQNWSGWWNLLLPVYSFEQLRLKRWYKEILGEYKPGVVNIQSRDEWIAVTNVAKKMGIKVLWTDHIDFRSWVLQNVDIWYKNFIGKKVLKIARTVDRIIVVSDYEKKYFDEVTSGKGLDNVEVIKNGVSDEFDDYKDKKVYKNSVCFVGRIVDYKGVRELLDAFLEVRKKIPDAVLNMYGKEENKGEFSKRASVNDGISFCGETSEPLKALAENEMFVLPSYREGLSLSLLDAAMMQKRIIASDVDGNPEVIVNRKTGLLVPAKDVNKLTEAVVWMLENKKEAEEMAKNARRRYKEYFDFEKIFEKKMLPLYNDKKEEKK